MRKNWALKAALIGAAVSMASFMPVLAQEAEEEEEVSYGSTEGFSYEEEVPENALFVELDWLDADVYSYTPSELYDPITSMMQVFYVYPDTPLESIDDAWTALKESGLFDLAEEEKAVVFYINPLDGAAYSDADYQQVLDLSMALSGNEVDFEYAFPYNSIILKKLFVIGEGSGADFVCNYLTNDIFSGMVAAEVLIDGESAPEETNYAIPAYLINCSDEVTAFYQSINETDAEDTLGDAAVYYNSSYVMDSGYTPKRVIVSESDAETLDSDLTQTVWNDLLRRVWNDILLDDYFIEGVEGGFVSDRPIPEELDLTFQEITGEEAEGTSQSRWYEWVPNEVFETMENGTDETYPLIVVMHGNGDHEIYEAESNGWVQLAGDERVIVVAMKDIFQSGFPPESAENRYGKENSEFVRDVICEKYPVDMSRIYIAGFSIGAFVTADTAAAAPDLFAAAAPMAYPGDGYMQIFPYDIYESDPDLYDMPIFYTCGRKDQGNTMDNPTDSSADRVLSTQLLFNQVMTFDEMEDQLIDLVDFEYDWYPGEDDPRTDWQTGEETGGYDFWDGTAAQYITQNLDFDAYPFYGFDVLALPNTTQDIQTTGEGIEYERNFYYNEEGWPMIEHLVMGDMGHNHYNRYARIIWEDLFSHYTRDPETGVLSYDGVEATK